MASVDAALALGSNITLCPDCTRAAPTPMAWALGWRPTVTIADGVVRYAAWLENNPRAVPVWLQSKSQEATA